MKAPLEPSGAVVRPTSRTEAITCLTRGLAWLAHEPPEMLASLRAAHPLQAYLWDALRLASIRRCSRATVENYAQYALAGREFDACWDDVVPGIEAARSARTSEERAAARRATLRVIPGGKSG